MYLKSQYDFKSGKHTLVPTFLVGIGYDTQYPYPDTHFFWVLVGISIGYGYWIPCGFIPNTQYQL